MNEGKENAVCFFCFFSSFQNGAIGTFDAQGRNLDERIGTGFKYDSDDTDGTGDTVEFQVRIEFSCQCDVSDRIGKADQLFQAAYEGFQFFFVEE